MKEQIALSRRTARRFALVHLLIGLVAVPVSGHDGEDHPLYLGHRHVLSRDSVLGGLSKVPFMHEVQGSFTLQSGDIDSARVTLPYAGQSEIFDNPWSDWNGDLKALTTIFRW